MSAEAVLVATLIHDAGGESYNDLLRSGPHWLFELTLEALTAPVAFALGWLWRNHILRHVHRDLREARLVSQFPVVRTQALLRADPTGPCSTVGPALRSEPRTRMMRSRGRSRTTPDRFRPTHSLADRTIFGHRAHRR